MTITLAAGATFQGVAGSATSVTCTVFGDELSTTGDTFKKLYQGQLPSSAGVLYTVGSSPVLAHIIKSIILVNTTGAGIAVTIYVDGVAATNSIGSFTIPAGGEANWSSSGWNMRDANGASLSTSNVTLTGDVTGTGTGSVATTLATVNASPGTTGDASHTNTIVTNAKGLVTSNTATAIQIAESQVTSLVSDLSGKQPTGNYITALTGDATASGPGSVAATLATVNTNVGSFGDASHVMVQTVNGKGLTTAASSVAIAIASGAVSGLGSLATVSNLTGPVTSTGAATAVTNNAITNAMLAQAATLTLKGNNAGGTANVADLTATQAKTLLAIASTDVSGLHHLATDSDLTGDITTSGSAATTLATVNASPGSTGDASHTNAIVTNAKGLVTSNTATAISITHANVTDFDTQVRTSTLNQMTAPTADLSINTHKLTSVVDPTNPQDAATKAYVDAIAVGLKIKPSVQAANTSGNITLSGTQTIDGIALVATNRVLLIAQTTASQNGIWLVQSSTWTRPTDFATGAEASGTFVFVEGGTLNASSGWTVSGEPPITIDTTSQTWTQFSGAGEVLPGNSLTKSGNTLNVTTTPATQTAVGATRALTAGTGIATIGDLSADRTIGLAAATANTFKANNTGSSAAPVDITVTAAKALLAYAAGDISGLTFFATLANLSGDVSTSGSGVTAIGANKVTNALLAQAATLTLKGNNTGGTANVSDLTAAQVKTLLAIASGDVSGLGSLATVSNLTGDVTSTGAATTLATVNSNTGTFGDASHVAVVTANGKGLITAASSTAIAIASTAVSGLGTLATQSGTFSGTSSGTNTGDQNVFSQVTGNSGTSNADTGSDTIAITGAAPISTAAVDSPDSLTISISAASATAAGSMSAKDYSRVRKEWDAYADFGLVADLRSVEELPALGTQVVMSSGSNVVNIPNSGSSTPFTSTAVDAGKRITVEGAGAGGAMLVGFIGVVNTLTQCTVLATVGGSALNASTTVTARTIGPVTVHVQWGTDNTTAISTMTTAINAQTYPCPRITFGGNESSDWTNAWGIPVPIVFNKSVWLNGIGSWHTTDIGDYTKTGSTRLAWWGTSSDGGTAFGAMITIAPTGTQALKRPRITEMFLDGRNGNQNQALWLLKWTSCHGAMIDGLGFMDALAGGMWTDVSSSPTEAADFTRFDFNAMCFRQLDDSLLNVPTTTPTTTSSTITLSTSGQTITLASVTGFAAGGGYAWCQSVAGKVFLFKYGAVSGSTLTGCVIAAEDSADPPVLAANLNVVPCTPSTAMAWKLSGNASHNTCCGSIRDVQVSYGGTWGPGAFEVYNSDTVSWDMIQMNGGSNSALINGNRMQRPGVRLNGSNSSATLASRNHTFKNIDPGGSPGGPLGGISVMSVTNAGAMLVAPSGPHYIDLQNMGNGAPVPTVELGASLFWSGNGMFREGAISSISIASQTLTAATGNIITGSQVVVPPQGWQIGTRLQWTIPVHKTGTVGTSWSAGVRQSSTIAVGGGTLIANVTFTASALADTGVLVIDLVCETLGASGTAQAQYRLSHNLTSTGLGTGAVTAGTTQAATPSGHTYAQGAMTAFNTSAPGSGPTFLWVEINPITASTAMFVDAPCSVVCLKASNP